MIVNQASEHSKCTLWPRRCLSMSLHHVCPQQSCSDAKQATGSHMLLCLLCYTKARTHTHSVLSKSSGVSNDKSNKVTSQKVHRFSVLFTHSTSVQPPLLSALFSTARGFEPLRAEPNGFRVHLLSHSDTVSWRRQKSAI